MSEQQKEKAINVPAKMFCVPSTRKPLLTCEYYGNGETRTNHTNKTKGKNSATQLHGGTTNKQGCKTSTRKTRTNYSAQNKQRNTP